MNDMSPYRRIAALQNVQSGMYGTQGDAVDWTYWDTVTIAAATLEHRLFTVPTSGAKPLWLTNMVNSGQIPQGQKLTIGAIKIMYGSQAAKATADVDSYYNMLQETTIDIQLQNKSSYGQWRLQEVMGAASLFALVPTAAGDNIPLIQPRFHGILPLNIPITLAAVGSFYVHLRHWVAPAAALEDDKITIGLSGILEKVS